VTRVTLINPPGIKTFSSIQMQTPNPPIGLAYIAAVLREAGVEYTVIDAVGEGMDEIRAYAGRGDMKVQGLTSEEILARIPADTDIIGLTCMFSTLWPLTRDLTAKIRDRFPSALIILGGEHGTAVPEHVLGNSAIDVVVLGEGVDTILSLVNTWRGKGRSGFRDLKGIAFAREDGAFVNAGLAPRKRDVDSIPTPDWDSFPLREYIDRHQVNGANIGRSMPILGTWGCPYQCTFCSNPAMWTQRWIPRNPKLLVDEMEQAVTRYGVTNFDFQDLTAMIRRNWIMELTEEILNRQLKVTWQLPSGTRAEVFDEEVAQSLYNAGLRLLAFAPESGSERILKLVRKEVDLGHMLAAMRAAIRAGLKLSCFIVIGFPGDTPESLRETLQLIRKMAWLGVHDIAVTKFVPYPGSLLFSQLQAEGRLELDDEFFIMPMDFYTSRAPSFSAGVTSKRLFWTMMWMFLNFYAIALARRPWRLLEAIYGTLRGYEATRLTKWFNDVLVVRPRWNRQFRKAAAEAVWS
jgi:anaerobic magnesium-protoporphyrin IX monomethyl ester cyclase